MLSNKVRVALVDDSPIALFMLRQIIAKDDRLEVVWEAQSAEEALHQLDNVRPDVLCSDYHMPGMNGIELITKIMVDNPLPTLLISVSVQQDERANIFKALEAGAVDIFPKPRGHADFSACDEKALCDRIYLISKVRVIRKHPPKEQTHRVSAGLSNTRSAVDHDQIITFGGSTGAPSVFFEVLSSLPATFPVPIVCVQHIGKGFVHSFVEWLNSGCALHVKVAEHGESITPGCVYFAPDECQFGIKNGKVFLDYSDPAKLSHKPSIDYLFHSLLDFSKGVAVLLSGMGGDGAKGMLALRKKGFHTIAQSQSSSTIYGIPRVAKEIDAVDVDLDAEKIGAALIHFANLQGLSK